MESLLAFFKYKAFAFKLFLCTACAEALCLSVANRHSSACNYAFRLSFGGGKSRKDKHIAYKNGTVCKAVISKLSCGHILRKPARGKHILRSAQRLIGFILAVNHLSKLVGKALQGIRDKVVIATKMGVYHNEDRTLSLDSSPTAIRKSIEGSLRRLGTDYVDLYYQHRIDPKVEPEVVAATMKELIKEGKIRAWGISETTEEYLRRANAVCPVTAIENRYSMMARWHESLFPVCEELGITFVAFSPMANGFLTGKYSPKTKFEGSQDYRKQMPQYSEEGYEKGKKLLDFLTGLAEEKKATLGQLSLAWMLAKKPYIIPIPGSRKLSRLKENLAAADVELTADEVARIDTELDGMDFEVFGGYAAR